MKEYIKPEVEYTIFENEAIANTGSIVDDEAGEGL